MAWIFLTATKNARADAVTAQLSTGAKLNIYTSAYGTLLATWTWTGNVWSAASGGALAMIAPTTNPVTPAANGVAAIARVTKSDNTTHIISDLTVGTSGTDVIVSNTTIATTAPVTLNSFALTEAA
jgi:hypothetical protein